MSRSTVQYVAFAGTQMVAQGSLGVLLPILKQRFDSDESDLVLIFDSSTGRQVDFDLRGSVDEVIAQALPQETRGPGRPRLGVTSREVSLLPRHWQWLSTQPEVRAALSQVLCAVAGNFENFEEACRALFAGKDDFFLSLIAGWPKDIVDFAAGQIKTAGDASDSH